MIFFDRKTVSVLRCIYFSGDRGVSWGKLQKKFGDRANIFLLAELDREQYTVTKNQYGDWISLDDSRNWPLHYEFRSFCTSKGNELLETRCFNFWKWTIPTLISVAALIVSAIAALN